MVYCGGLENRFGLTADGGSNPSLSARLENMQDLVWILILAAVVVALFIWGWRAGHLARLTDYVKATREELRKCSWPTWAELKGSTIVVGVAILILGGYTVLVDQIFFRVFMFFKI